MASVERFFQFSLLGLIASGLCALAATGFPDRPTLILTFAGLVIRAAMVAGILRIEIPVKAVSFTALAYVAFFPIDYYFISHDFLTTTVHGICFLATLKILTAKSGRDYVYVGAISFIELIAAAMLSGQSSFFAWLALYVLFAIAAFTSGEIRRGFERHKLAVAQGQQRIGWPLAVVAITSLCGILILTAGLFLLVPRTARMAAMFFPNGPRLTGFSNMVDLGGFGKISRDDRAVMHILPYSRALPPNLKWRGAALSHFDGRRWTEPPFAGRPIPTVQGYAEVANESQRSRRDGRRMIYRVDLQNSGTGALFIAGVPEFINIDARTLVAASGDSFRVFGAPSETLRYEVSAHSGPPLPADLTPRERARYLALPALDIRIYDLARKWSGQGEPRERAQRISEHLRQDFTYALEDTETPVRDPLADFLFVRRRGYCEYFASAMAVMLRMQGIPSRVATGFQSGYFNDVSGLYVVRASDAHAWVEAWIEGSGWTTFDPTPAAAEKASEWPLWARIDMYLDAADHTWHEWVVSYDLGHQVAMAAKFEAALRGWNRSVAPTEKFGLKRIETALAWGAGLLAGLVVLYFCRPLLTAWRRRALVRRIAGSGGSASDASVLYERMLELLATRGFEKPGWSTPVEFARGLSGEEKRRVVEFTAVYNSIRFGGEVSATARLAGMLREFEG